MRAVSGLPPRPILRRLVRAAAMMWLVARLVIGVLGAIVLSPAAALAFSVVVVGLVWLDMRSTREGVLYGNLAVSPRMLFLVVWIVVACLELVAGVAMAALTLGPPADGPL